MYYFKLEVTGMSQFTYGMLGVVGGIWLVIAVLIYQLFLSKLESRTLIVISTLIAISASFSDLCFVLRWNITLGISDIYWLMFGAHVF